jgi:hypothetical protein
MTERIDTKAVLERLPTDPTECSGTPEPHAWDEGKTLEEAEEAGSYCQTCGIEASVLHLLLDARVALTQEIGDRDALGEALARILDRSLHILDGRVECTAFSHADYIVQVAMRLPDGVKKELAALRGE